MARIEREAKIRANTHLLADVSISTEPFFRRLRFSLIRRQFKIYPNRAFKQAVIEKRLISSGRVRREEDDAFRAALTTPRHRDSRRVSRVTIGDVSRIVAEYPRLV